MSFRKKIVRGELGLKKYCSWTEVSQLYQRSPSPPPSPHYHSFYPTNTSLSLLLPHLHLIITPFTPPTILILATLHTNINISGINTKDIARKYLINNNNYIKVSLATHGADKVERKTL